MALLDEVANVLRSNSTSLALIGAAAMAHHGVSRSTLDQDLLVVEPRTLADNFWAGIRQPASVEIRVGDADDPLAGVIRIRSDGERDVDVVVGRSAWQSAIIDRAHAVGTSGVPVVEAADLVLLKLYAGGSQDKWDIEQLMAHDSTVASIVDARVGALPVRAREIWTRIRSAAEF